VAGDLLDLALLLEVGKSAASQAAVDLETVDQGGDGHETVGLDILVELLKGGLLEDNGVLSLVLDYRQKIMLVAVSWYVVRIFMSVSRSKSTIHIRSRNDSKSRLLRAVVAAGRERKGSKIVVTVGWMEGWMDGWMIMAMLLVMVMAIAYPCPCSTSSFAFLRVAIFE
jgi:hypothetical protein